MEANPILFRDLTYIFLAAVLGGLVAWRLRLPLILGFVLGGIAISPFTPGPRLSDLHTFEVFAEVGVVLLMFSIGIEFSIPDLLRVKWVALVGGPLGILLLMGISVGVGKLAGWSVTQGIVIGAAISVASTMVLARLLSDTGKLTETYGRVMIGISLVEDLVVICLTVVLPVFGGSGDGSLTKAAWTLGKALLLLIPLTFLAIKVIPRLLRRIKLTCNPELFLLVAIAVCLGTAALAQAAGFSVALGAFVAGLSISGLEGSARCAYPARATSRHFRGAVFRLARNLDRSQGSLQQFATPGRNASTHCRRKIPGVGRDRVALPIPYLDRHWGGRGVDADWRTVVRGRASGAVSRVSG